MIKKIVFYFFCLFFVTAVLPSMDPHKRRIDSFGDLVKEFQKNRETHRERQVAFDLPTRKGPVINAEPDTKKPHNERK